MVKTAEFNDSIKNFLEDIDEWIVSNDFIVSGSFVISNILDEHYDESDIDIYVNYPFVLKDPDNVDSEFEEWLVEKYGAVLRMDNYNMLDVRSHKYIIRNFKDINIINLPGKNKDEIKEYIKTTSDLDICTSCYDGFFVEFPISVLMKKAIEINIDHEQINYREFKSYVFKRKLRILKYRNRGFEVYTNFNIDENFELESLKYSQKRRYEDQTILYSLDYICKHITSRKQISQSESCLTMRFFTGENIIINTSEDVEIPKWVEKWKEKMQI